MGRAGHDDIMAFLLTVGQPDVNSKNDFGHTILHMAALGKPPVRKQSHLISKLLLNHPDFVELDTCDSAGHTALEIALRSGNTSICTEILRSSLCHFPGTT